MFLGILVGWFGAFWTWFWGLVWCFRGGTVTPRNPSDFVERDYGTNGANWIKEPVPKTHPRNIPNTLFIVKGLLYYKDKINILKAFTI